MLWLYIARARANEDGAAELSALAVKLKTKEWPYPMTELFLSKQSPEATLQAAGTPDNRCEAQFYIGEWRVTRGEREAAVDLLKAAAESCPKTFIEYEGAVAELKRLGP